ncbi:MAG: hypothetical protein AAFR96_07370 [Planctomycetota bacterium]
MWKSLGLGLALACVVGLVVVVPRWLDAPRAYGHSTPEELVESFASMVEAGEVERIPELIYAEDEAMRLMLRQMGVTLREVRALGDAVNGAFPEDVQRLRRDAEEAASRGEATSLLGRLGRSVGRAGGGRRSGGRTNPGDAINLAVRDLLASPYAAFDEARERLTTIEVNDGQAALMWDGQMVLPPFGVSLKRDERDGDWYIVLPLDLPFLTQYRPRTETQWQIAAYMMQAWRNAAIDLREGIESGELRSLDAVASKAGATVGPTTVMIGLAYSKQFDEDEDASGG